MKLHHSELAGIRDKMAARRTLRNVQALRAVAASAVLSYHVLYELAHRAGYQFSETTIGASGVDLFFLISGFIMMYTAADSFGVPGAAAAFLHRRIVRIAPLYWLCTTVVLLLLAFFPRLFTTVSFDWGSAVSSYLFLLSRNSAGQIGTVLQTGWTLCYEFYFYAVFALLLCTQRRFFLLLSGAVFAGGILFGRLDGNIAPWAGVATDPLLIEFYVGAAIGILFLKGFALPRAVSVLTICLALATIALARGIDLGQWTRVVLWGVPSAAILLAAVSVEQGGWIAPSILVRLGDSSYSLYLIHPLVLPVVGKAALAVHAAQHVSPIVFGVAAFVASLIIGHVTYLLVELPVTTRLSKTFVNRDRSLTPSSQAPGCGHLPARSDPIQSSRVLPSRQGLE